MAHAAAPIDPRAALPMLQERHSGVLGTARLDLNFGARSLALMAIRNSVVQLHSPLR